MCTSSGPKDEGDSSQQVMQDPHKMNQTEQQVSIFVGALFILICCIGVPVNIFAIKMLAHQTKATSKLIDKIPLSLCISNLIQMFPLYLFSSVACIAREWVYSMPICHFMGFWVHFNANVSIWHLVAYAWEQRRALGSCTDIHPASYRMSKWKQYGILSMVWLHGLFWSAIPFAGWANYQFEGLRISCSVSWERTDFGSQSYTVCILIFNFILPVVAIIYCYTKIFQGFKNHVVSVSASVGMTTNDRNQVKLRKLAFIGSFMTATFLFSWAPYAIVAAITIITQGATSPIAITIPAVFGKASVVIYPSIILLKRSSLRFRLAETSTQAAPRTQGPTSRLQ